jgi:serine/threonine-protein kinase RsbW
MTVSPGGLAEVSYRGPASAPKLPAVRQKLADCARQAGLDTDVVADLTLACQEAMANVVEHAYGEDGGELEVLATRTETELVVTVADRGRWVDSRGGTGSRRGRGLQMIRMLAHSWHLEAGSRGTTLVLHWRLPAE